MSALHQQEKVRQCKEQTLYKMQLVSLGSLENLIAKHGKKKYLGLSKQSIYMTKVMSIITRIFYLKKILLSKLLWYLEVQIFTILPEHILGVQKHLSKPEI